VKQTPATVAAVISSSCPYCVVVVCGCCVELDEEDMALMAEATGEPHESKTNKKDKDKDKDGGAGGKKEDELPPDYDAVVAADVEGLCHIIAFVAPFYCCSFDDVVYSVCQ